jgi:hypothetical protein
LTRNNYIPYGVGYHGNLYLTPELPVYIMYFVIPEICGRVDTEDLLVSQNKIIRFGPVIDYPVNLSFVLFIIFESEYLNT